MLGQLARPRWSRLVPTSIQVAAPFVGIGVFLFLRNGAAGSPLGDSEEFGIWVLLIVGQVMAWFLLAGAGLHALIELWQRLGDWGLRPEQAAIKTAVYLVFGYLVVTVLLRLYQEARAHIAPGGDDAGLQAKVVVLTVLAYLATLPHAITLKLVQLASADGAAWGSIDLDVPRMRYLRAASLTAAAALAFVIAMAVLATGALRQALAAGGLRPFPEIYIIFYGLLFSGLLGAIYLHAFNALDARGQSTLDGAAPFVDPMPADDYSTVHKARTELASELQIGGDIRKNLEGLLVVISPLVSAVFSSLAGISA